MKKRIIIIISIMLLLPAFSLFSQDRMLEIYKNIAEMSKKQIPPSYRVRVNNRSFSEALKELPSDILTGKGEPAVVIQFQRGKGVSIVIENVKKEYSSLFSIYEDYLKFSGISKVQNPDELKTMLDKDKLKLYSEDGSSVVIQAWDPEKLEKDNNYALFTFDKKNWVINKAVYFLDGNPYVQVENSYKLYGKYYMPSKIVLRNLADNTTEEFIFEDYRFGN